MKISILGYIYLAAILILAGFFIFSPEQILKPEYLITGTVTTAAIMFVAMTRHIGLVKTLYLFLLSAIIGFISELVGLYTGQFYGGYEYTEFLGPQLLNVPLVIPVAWFMAITTSFMFARLILGFGKKISTSIMFAFAAVLAVVYDLPIEYLAKEVWGAWVWLADGALLDVPTLNYLGWFLVAFIVYGLGSREWRTINRSASGYRDLQIVCFSSFALLLFHVALHWFGFS